jgi:hypothetical protein
MIVFTLNMRQTRVKFVGFRLLVCTNCERYRSPFIKLNDLFSSVVLMGRLSTDVESISNGFVI